MSEALWIELLQKWNDATDERVRKYEEWAVALSTKHPDITVDVVTSRGDPRGELVRIIKEHAIDIAVLGGRGLSPLRYAFVGSVSQFVVNHVTIPVVVVHSPDMPATTASL